MSISKACILIAISLLYAQVASAQTKASLSVVPAKVANAEFLSLDGSPSIRLSAYRKKVVVVALWASWCPPCGTALESLGDIKKGFASRGVEVIGLSIEDPKTEAEKVLSFLRIYKIDFKVGWISEEMAKALIERDSIPQIFVVAGDGLIVRRFIGWHPDKSSKLLRRTVKQALRYPPVMQ